MRRISFIQIVRVITGIVFLVIVLTGCQSKKGELRVGVIAPSTDWLPVVIAFEEGFISEESFRLFRFSSGWEANEALIAGKVDVAIIPFTYAWKGVSEGKDIRIVSFFERESDGIVTSKEITELVQLDGRKIGVLRASTLDIFVHLVAQIYKFEPEIVYFRTPTEMAAALQNGLVDALSFYVPQIFRLGDGFQAIYWFGDDYPDHPCCDVVATGKAIEEKRTKLFNFMEALSRACDYIKTNREESVEIMMKTYNLSTYEAEQTLKYTGFTLSLDKKGKQFELMTAQKMQELGYLRRVPDLDEVFYYGFID